MWCPKCHNGNEEWMPCDYHRDSLTRELIGTCRQCNYQGTMLRKRPFPEEPIRGRGKTRRDHSKEKEADNG